jgi:hypothetical protein
LSLIAIMLTKAAIDVTCIAHFSYSQRLSAFRFVIVITVSSAVTMALCDSRSG